MEDTTLQKYALMISFMLPEGMLDWFDVIRVEETDLIGAKKTTKGLTVKANLDEKTYLTGIKITEEAIRCSFPYYGHTH